MGGVQRPREEKGLWHWGGCGWLAAVCDGGYPEGLQRFKVIYICHVTQNVKFDFYECTACWPKYCTRKMQLSLQLSVLHSPEF